MSGFIGSRAHRDLLCEQFIETHDPYQPTRLDWPALDEADRARLGGLPIWKEAVKTEAATALIVQVMGETVEDPVFARAIKLQGFEEARHAELLGILTSRYGIEVPAFTPQRPRDPAWAFMRIGYGECFDSFFAFGLYALARDAGFLPPALSALFEPVMQEEARHILFHVNWIAFQQAQLRFTRRPSYVFRRALAIWLQAVRRLKTALHMKGEVGRSQKNFTMTAHRTFRDISASDFVSLCLAENERRLAPYDPRLLRPAFVPAMARATLKALP